MFTNFFKLAFRNIRKNKAFSTINMLGLTIGLASCILIGLYVFNEMSFDHFNHAYARIFRINKITNEKGKQASRNGITPGQLAPALEQELPEVEHATRFRPWFNDMLVSNDTVKILLKDVAFADAGFLEVFDFPLISGNRKTALTEPFTAVITATTAEKYFGKTDPMGKTLITLNNIPVKVTGVSKDPPSQSSLQFSMLISWPTTTAKSTADNFFWMNNWLTQVNFTFIELKEQASEAAVETKVSKILHSHLPEKEYQYSTYLQPLGEIHLGSEGIQYASTFRTNNGKLVRVLLIIAGFILLIACFNFINLTTASALGRARETGIQKVLGAQRGQLVLKYFSESLLLCTLSLLLAVLIAALLLPAFNDLANSNLTLGLLGGPKMALIGFGCLLLISLIAGLYPALFMARFKSTDVFRNMLKAGKDNWLRKSLVTTQFVLAILLIVATLVVKNQMHYLSSKDLGFNKEQMVVLTLANTGLESKSKEFIQALKQFRGIASICTSNRVPGQSFNGYGIVPEGFRLEDHLEANVLETDVDFQSTYAIQLQQGRYFSSEFPSDTTNSVVINEAMARYLNWKKPIGKQFEIYEEMKGRVIGVLKDFNVTSLRDNVEPLALMLRSNPLQLSIRLKAGTTRASLNFLKKTWKEFAPEYPFAYFFLDEEMNQFYQSDIRLLKVLGIFSGLAICIACMGLLGLSMYAARQRVKEIGIRKVLGAGILNITSLMSKDFLKLVLVAALISFPLAWWATNAWLEDFAYRIHLNAWIFIVAGCSVLFVALVTVSVQAIKAALANPVKSLRRE